MQKQLLSICLFFFLALFISCTSTVMLNKSYPSKNNAEEIEVLLSKAPSRNYTEIALIKCENFTDNLAIESMKKKARKLGADAILIVGSASKEKVISSEGNTIVSKMEDSGFTAIAIKYNNR